jgi:hypothetical protein
MELNNQSGSYSLNRQELLSNLFTILPITISHRKVGMVRKCALKGNNLFKNIAFEVINQDGN